MYNVCIYAFMTLSKTCVHVSKNAVWGQKPQKPLLHVYVRVASLPEHTCNSLFADEAKDYIIHISKEYIIHISKEYIIHIYFGTFESA